MANYYQSPGPSATLYQVDVTGDSYTLVTGGENAPYSSGMATVVNYSVAQAIINASQGWTTIPESIYLDKSQAVKDLIGSSKNLDITFGKITAYRINEFSYVSIMDNAIQGFWCEQVNYNQKSLEFSILRNNNYTYVNNLKNFLESGLSGAVVVDFNSEYLPIRNSAAGQLVGTGSTTKYFVVQNLVTKRGRVQTDVYGMPRFGDAGSWTLYEKQGDILDGPRSYVLLDGECVGYCSKKAWLTDVYVDTSGGRPTFSFPRGGTATRGEQFYIDIVSRFI